MKKTALTVAALLGTLLAATTAAAQDNPPAPTDPAAQPTPPTQPAQPTSPPAQPDPAAPTGPTAEPPSGPSVSLSTGNPPSDTTQSEPAPEEKKEKPRPFAGSQIFAQTSMYTGTVIKSQQLDYNPTAEFSLFLQPRYAINKDWQLRGRLVFNYEFTNSDSTTTKYEPRFSDTTLQIFYRSIPPIPKAGVKILAGAQAALPTSPESRARTMYVSPGLVVQAVKGFEKVLGGEIDLIGSVSYAHPFYKSKTPEVRGDGDPNELSDAQKASIRASNPQTADSIIAGLEGQRSANGHLYQYKCAGGGNGCDGQLSGTANASDIITWSTIVSGEWGKWSPALFLLGSHQFAYTFKDDATVETAGGQTTTPTRLSDRTKVRQSMYFSAWVDYNANSWLTAEVGYYMFRSLLNEDGSYGNPFFNRYQDTRVYLGANVNVDNFVKEVIQKDKGEGGVVRAKNRRGPMILAF